MKLPTMTDTDMFSPKCSLVTIIKRRPFPVKSGNPYLKSATLIIPAESVSASQKALCKVNEDLQVMIFSKRSFSGKDRSFVLIPGQGK
ncbi:MAG TPA: hypothetical protein DGX96_10685 [Lachnospiraceae bacterium]|jgi:hypothetical protein|nr:hypothetical protein [Lachnospiraceae bacterium]